MCIYRIIFTRFSHISFMMLSFWFTVKYLLKIVKIIFTEE